ncbi:DUF4440 domain-containing protein [Iodobacter sp. LRB]|uniref:nuclear transport factor 2 family protein n=1 Tax=unclassified Iodobacter TaxID=235634 RepID=UPI000C0F0380|nr:DUF4440 domain-containing protein [Iodobacter sp. BJB302]PHV00106.1 DUF4440 domain-containing protein [Iodobacter sp. BJB302]
MAASDFSRKFIDLECLLLKESTRLDAQLLNKLIDDDFQEFGASGCAFGKSDVVERLPSGPAPTFYPQNFAVVELAPSVVQVTFRLITYRPDTPDASYSLRSSLWRLSGGEWKMIFHQGTRTDAFEKA